MRERLLAFLNQRPARASHLVLVTADVAGTEIQVAAWPVEELSGAPREYLEHIVAAAQDDCDERGRGTYTALWVEVTEAGRAVLRRRAMRFAPNNDAPAAAQATANEDVSLRELMRTVISHHENMHKLYVHSMGSVVIAQKDIITELAKSNEVLLRKYRQATERDPEQPIDVDALARAAAWEKVAEGIAQHVMPRVADWVSADNGKGRPA
jgi:hypothetical protein